MISRIVCVAYIALLLSSCGINFVGQYPIIKSDIFEWEKIEGNTEQRRIDLTDCGGFSDDNYGPSDERIRLEQKPGEQYRGPAIGRIERRTNQCMIDKGYRYVGNCAKTDFKYRPGCNQS